VPFPSHLERPIREVIDVDVLACQLVCQFTALQDDLPSVVRKGKLLAEVTLLAMTEDVGQIGYLHVQPAMQVLGLGWRKCELLVEAPHELRQESAASIYVRDVCQAQLPIKRSCNAQFACSTRPFAWLEFAHRISMLSSARARPNCLMPEPPFASGLFIRKTLCLSE
jgi:hypothetical protein